MTKSTESNPDQTPYLEQLERFYTTGSFTGDADESNPRDSDRGADRSSNRARVGGDSHDFDGGGFETVSNAKKSDAHYAAAEAASESTTSKVPADDVVSIADAAHPPEFAWRTGGQWQTDDDDFDLWPSRPAMGFTNTDLHSYPAWVDEHGHDYGWSEGKRYSTEEPVAYPHAAKLMSVIAGSWGLVSAWVLIDYVTKNGWPPLILAYLLNGTLSVIFARAFLLAGGFSELNENYAQQRLTMRELMEVPGLNRLHLLIDQDRTTIWRTIRGLGYTAGAIQILFMAYQVPARVLVVGAVSVVVYPLWMWFSRNEPLFLVRYWLQGTLAIRDRTIAWEQARLQAWKESGMLYGDFFYGDLNYDDDDDEDYIC